MIFEIKILGTGSATPAHKRHPSAQVINSNDQLYLLDCGEGTQIQFLKYHVRASRVNNIFISHLHGDHFFGIMGLLNSMNLNGKTEDVNLYAPYPLSDFLTHMLKMSNSRFQFQLNFIPTEPQCHYVLWENEHLQIETIPLKHNIECCGFLFKEKTRKRKIDTTRIDLKNIPPTSIKDLKNGLDIVTPEGKNVFNREVTLEPPLPRSYAYCTDTLYSEEIIPIIKDVDILYHEATFLNDMFERAKETCHSTTLQAGQIARLSACKKLIIGHYSSRYKEIEPFLEETKQEFPDTSLAKEGDVITIPEIVPENQMVESKI